MAVAAGGDPAQRRAGRRRVEQVDLAGDVRAGGDQQEAGAARLGDRDEEGRVVLLVEDGIAGRVVAQPVGADTVGPQILVELDIEQRPPVLGPLDRAGGVDDQVGQLVAAVQIAQMQPVALGAVLVGGVGEQPAVGADVQGAQVEVGLALGQLDLVQEDDRLSGIERPAVPGPVLGAREELPVILEAALAHRHRAVVGLDPRLELGVQMLDLRPQRRHEALEPGVLGLEIGADLGVRDLRVGGIAQPGIVVGPAQAEALVADRASRCPRRCLLRHEVACSVPARVPPQDGGAAAGGKPVAAGPCGVSPPALGIPLGAATIPISWAY